MIDVPYNVKRALKDGDRPKQYRFQVLNDDETVDFTIDNDTLVKESVKIDERMCSGDRLKFGLCEGASLEFQYFNHPNIRGRRVKVFLDVAYDNEGTEAYYPLSMGYFDVDQCSTQFSTGIIKAVAYNRLKSEYLDQKANIILEEMFPGSTSELFFNIRHALLDEYEINTYTQKPWGKCDFVVESTGGTFNPSTTITKYFPTGLSNRTTIIMSCKYEITLDPDKFYKFVWTKGDVDAWETSIYDLIISAMQTDSVPDASINDAINNLLGTYNTYLGCYTLFGVVLTDQNNQEKIYSKKAYDNNKYGAVGPVSDLTKNYYHGCTKITLYMPLFYGLSRLNQYLTRGFYLKEAAGEKFIQYYRTVMNSHVYIVSNLIAQIDDNNNHGWRFTSYDGQVPSQADVVSIYGFSDGIGLYDNYASYAPNSYDYVLTTGYVDFKFPNGESTSKWQDGEEHVHGGAFPVDVNEVFIVNETEALNDADYITVNPNDMAEITARESLSAVYELSACYGTLNRDTNLFSPVELNSGSLVPAATLYPSASLYPNQGYGSNIFRPFPSEYQKLWTDSVGEQTFRYLIITYKAIEYDQQGNPTEVDKTLQRTVHEHGTTNYNCSDNWLFRNLVWTAEQVGAYADAMVEKMLNIRWFPFEMWSTGLPYVEVGDAIEIADKEGDTHISYVLQRQLNGIQNLQDTYINGQLDIF